MWNYVTYIMITSAKAPKSSPSARGFFPCYVVVLSMKSSAPSVKASEALFRDNFSKAEVKTKPARKEAADADLVVGNVIHIKPNTMKNMILYNQISSNTNMKIYQKTVLYLNRTKSVVLF